MSKRRLRMNMGTEPRSRGRPFKSNKPPPVTICGLPISLVGAVHTWALEHGYKLGPAYTELLTRGLAANTKPVSRRVPDEKPLEEEP